MSGVQVGVRIRPFLKKIDGEDVCCVEMTDTETKVTQFHVVVFLCPCGRQKLISNNTFTIGLYTLLCCSSWFLTRQSFVWLLALKDCPQSLSTYHIIMVSI